MNCMPGQGEPSPGPDRLLSPGQPDAGHAYQGYSGRHALPTRAELEAMEEFISAKLEDRAPGVEEHLGRYPQFADSLRPVLEGAELFHREYRRLKKKYPGYSLGRYFGLKP
jgi:hypothetical protein